MTPKTLAATVLALAVVVAGTAAAVPAIGAEDVQLANQDASPDDEGADKGGNADDARDGDGDDETDDSADRRGNADDARDGDGDDETDDGADQRGDADDAREGAPGHDDAASDRRGPPATMPDPVPGFVSDLHDRIGQSLDGANSGLGEAIASITPGDRPADGDESASDANESARDANESDWSQSSEDDRSRPTGSDDVATALTAPPGPPGGLPGPVPDFVGGILDAVSEFVPDLGDVTPEFAPVGR